MIKLKFTKKQGFTPLWKVNFGKNHKGGIKLTNPPAFLGLGQFLNIVVRLNIYASKNMNLIFVQENATQISGFALVKKKSKSLKKSFLKNGVRNFLKINEPRNIWLLMILRFRKIW